MHQHSHLVILVIQLLEDHNNNKKKKCFFLLMLDKNSCQIWGHQVKFVKAQVEKCLLTSVAFADNVALHLLVLMTASCIKAKMMFSIRAALSDATVAKSIFYVQSVVQGLYEHIQTACLNNSVTL